MNTHSQRTPFGRAVVHAALLGLAGASLLPSTMNAQKDGAPRIEFTKFTLPNGLRVVMSVDKSAPIVATFVHYHVGSKNERPDRTGFAHFFEHLMFEGTDNIPRHSLDKKIEAAGGFLNAFTSFDETGYQLKLPSNQLKLALWIESERMLHAKVEEIGVETQRGVVKEERKLRYDNTPYGSLIENIAKYAASGTPYAWTPIGSAQYIDQAKIDEFRDFYKEYYIPNNAVLAIVGDIDPVETRKWVEEYFTDIPKGPEIKRPSFDFPKMTLEQSVDVREPHTPLPALVYAYRAPKRGEKDAYAMDMLSTIMATGNSSRLYREMVDRKRLAVAAQSFYFDQEMGGMLGLFAVAHPTTTIDKLGEEFDRRVVDLRDNGVSDREVQKALNQIETSYSRRFDDVLDKAQALASYETYFNDPDLINTEFDRYRSVTAADIQRVAREWLVPTNRVVLKYYPASGGN